MYCLIEYFILTTDNEDLLIQQTHIQREQAKEHQLCIGALSWSNLEPDGDDRLNRNSMVLKSWPAHEY